MVDFAAPNDGNGSSADDARAASVLPLLLTAADVARLLRISERTLWRKVSAGEVIAPLRIGGTTRWNRAGLEAWVAEGCPPAFQRKNNRRR